MDVTDISALSSPIVTVSPSPFLLASLVRAPISSGLAPARGKDGKNKLRKGKERNVRRFLPASFDRKHDFVVPYLFLQGAFASCSSYQKRWSPRL